MGGLAKKIPITFVTLLCAGVAIAGVPPFSGFYSKDAILGRPTNTRRGCIGSA